MPFLLLLLPILLLFLSGIRFAQPSQRGVVFRFGGFNRVAGPGFYLMLPFIERQRRVDLQPRVLDLGLKEIVSLDGHTIKAQVKIKYRITNPEYAIDHLEDHQKAVRQFAMRSLCDLISKRTQEDVRSDQAKNDRMLQKITEVSLDDWGVKIEEIRFQL